MYRSYMNDYDVNNNPFQQSLPMALISALDNVLPAFRRLFAKNGLTEQQWRVLRVLWQSESLSSIEISRLTLIQPNSLVGVLERLEKRKIIARVRSLEDRRIVYARLLPAGRELERAIAPELNAIHMMINARLDAEEWQMFADLLAKATGVCTSIEEKNHG
jgi:homoprotocatechuate degradation regulator HpaR